ncbi:MAG: glycoside hydrolase family 5 protein [Deltaproteobacteria bacterium]|nr:glycoside hydrolase family 5 protein [Deltaproteobacteria bacterium]MBN2673616.1 glycoside hydrolase family 5 protein [Deltaproteobacteria bacterium]
MRLNTLILLMITLCLGSFWGCTTDEDGVRPGVDGDADSDSDGDGDADGDSDSDSDSDGDAVGFVGDHGRLQVSGSDIVDGHGDPIQVKGLSWYWSMWQGDWFRADVVDAIVEDFNVTVVRAPLGILSTDKTAGYILMNEDDRAKHLAMVETVVDAAIDNGIYVIIDWHDHWANEHEAEAIEFFHHMGQRYGNAQNIIWEIWNEPDYGEEWSVIKAYGDAVIPVIRQYSDNLILVGSSNYSYSIIDPVTSDAPFTQDNIAYSFHFYVENNSHSLNIAQAYVDAVREEGLPVFVSEWGLEVSNTDSYVNSGSFMTADVDDAKVGPWMDWMDEKGLSWVFWSVSSATESSAMFNSSAKDSVGNWSYDDDLRPAGQYIYDYFN